MSAEMGLIVVNQAELKALLAGASSERGEHQAAVITKLDAMSSADIRDREWLDSRVVLHLDSRLNMPYRSQFIWRGIIRPTGDQKITRFFDYQLPGQVEGNRVRLDYQVLPGEVSDAKDVGAILYFISSNVIRLDFSHIPTQLVITRWPVATFQIEQMI